MKYTVYAVTKSTGKREIAGTMSMQEIKYINSRRDYLYYVEIIPAETKADKRKKRQQRMAEAARAEAFWASL